MLDSLAVSKISCHLLASSWLWWTSQTSVYLNNLSESLCQKRSDDSWLIHMVEMGRFVYNTIRLQSLLPAFFLKPHKAWLNLTNSISFFCCLSLENICWELAEPITELRGEFRWWHDSLTVKKSRTGNAWREGKAIHTILRISVTTPQSLIHFRLFTARLIYLHTAAAPNVLIQPSVDESLSWKLNISVDFDNYVWLERWMSFIISTT